MKTTRILLTLSLTGAASAFIDLNPFLNNVGSTLTGIAEGLEGTVQMLGPEAGRVVLAEAMKVYPEASESILEFQDAVQQLTNTTLKIQEELKKKNATILEHLADRLSNEIGGTLEDLKEIMNDPLPEEHGERAKARARIAKQVIHKIGVAYIDVLSELGIPRDEATAQFDDFGPKILQVILILGNIADDHPKLVEALVFFVLMTVLPEIPIVRPILNCIGFGPLGPVKGSAAASAQRTFFGGAVTSGSWFAMLQRAGMTETVRWLDKVIVSGGVTAIVGHILENRESS
ncbi:hypothetical protein NP233_g11305 [Leucocoprinus birnbaumii]|uniref:Uncharacterized protein n=1 Tax=Leucocoprinus birnbaumii TaxID=56174 RepID=A0AAD5YLE5_9AGAR|nr:hypothetical protein NP233_g11305 [Leucocoprinus birnbaumii]